MISVVIPNYNGKKILEACLNSLEEQSYKKFEIIIVDNGSSDGSQSFIKKIYPNVELVALDKNYGFSYAVNRGIEASTGEYIALLNNDTKVDSQWLYNLYNAMQKDEKVFSVGSKMIRFDDTNIIDDAGEEYNLLGWAYQLGAGKSIDKYNNAYKVFANCGGAVIYRRDILDKIGYFDESFFAYMEDIDIGYRALINGYKNIYEPTAKVLHIGSATSGSKYNSFKARLVARNNVWVPYKNMPFLQYVMNIPFLILGTIIKLMFFYKKGLAKDYIAGLQEGVKGLKTLEKTRYKNQRLKCYIYIQWLLIRNTFKYVYEKVGK